MFDRPAIKKEAKIRMREHKPSVYLVTVVYIVIVTLLAVLESKLSGEESLALRLYDLIAEGVQPDYGMLWEIYDDVIGRITTFAVILTIAIKLVESVIEVGFTRFSLCVWKREPATVGTMFDEFAHFFKVIWLTILTGIMVFLWSLLFVVPGIVAAYRYSFAHHILIENPEMGVLDCIRESKRLTQGYKGELFVLDLSFLGWIFIGIAVANLVSIVAGVGIDLFAIWLMPYMSVTKSGFYRTRIEAENPIVTEQKPEDPWQA